MERQKQIRLSGMDADTSLELIDDGSYLNLMNGRIGISEYGKALRIENTNGTTLITNNKIPPYGTNMCIGSCIDYENNRLIFFLYNTFSDHGIYCYDLNTQTMYAVLYDSQVAGGLNFNKNYLIARNARVVNGLLYWTDNYNEPKKINIDSGIKLNQPSYVTDQPAYTSLTDSYEITLIRRPPTYSPSIAKQTDTSFVNNFIANDSFQFAWQYIYYDGETSSLSEFSTASKLNGLTLEVEDTYNYIACVLSTLETIPQTARIIRLIVKYQSTGNCFVAYTWDKEISETPFTQHNSGGAALSYNFYGDILGEAIDNATSVLPYYSVPLKSKTLESATLRLFLGNNLEGYDTPTTTTSLVATANSSTSGANIVTNVLEIQLLADYDPMYNPFYLYCYSLYIDTLPQVGYYYILGTKREQYNTPPTMPAVPTTGTLASLEYMGATINDVALFWQGRNPLDYYNNQGYVDTGTAYTVTGIDSTSQLYFKNESTYQLGIVFYDKALRKCGVSTRPELLISTPKKTYANNVGYATINWTLYNANAKNEIPDWAYYYSIVRTLNQKTRYFIDSIATLCYYANKNLTTGVYEFTATSYDAATTVAIAISTTALNNNKMGYTYNDGDVCVINLSGGTRYELPVIGQSGIYILVKPKDIGSLSGATLHYEIYTPYIKNENEPYYEVGNMYPVTNAGTNTRQYSTLTGSLNGDIFIFKRVFNSTFFTVEAMSPNDRYYQLWYTDAGRANYVTLLGQARNENQIRYSGTYVKGTQNNNLSAFEALNQNSVPLNVGSIQKLQLTTKTEEQGVIMLGICANQTVSCYLGQVQLVGASANAFVAQDTAVIGTINVLKGMFGTTAPETVIEYLGLVFWYDLKNGAIVQYSTNGLFPVSTYKMTSFFQRYAKDYNAASPLNLDNINGFHHIPTCIDPFHKRFMVTTPALIYQNYATVLPSYNTTPSYATSIINRFNPYTKLGQTICLDFEENRWKESFEFMPEWMDYQSNILFGFKNGQLYTHDTNTVNYNTYYGTTYPVRFYLTPNMPLGGVKDVFNVVVEGNAKPNYSVLYTTYPNVQITDLTSDEYTDEEGVMYARWLRDRLTPGTGTVDQKLYSGDVMKSKTPMIQLEFQQYSALMYIQFVDVNFDISYGQKGILQK